MYKKIKWTLILIISIITSLILIGGFITSLSITSNNKKKVVEKTPTSEEKTNMGKINPKDYNILVLGDSLAKGTGDEKGKGFAGYFADSWKNKIGEDVKVKNLGVNGDVSSGLLNIVKNSETQNYIKNSKVILISIGANEITKFIDTNIILEPSAVKNVQENYITHLKEIFQVIRQENNSSLVVFIGLYNPFGDNITLDKIDFLSSWNYYTEEFIESNANSIFIPTYDLFKYNLDSYLTVDKFHPNSSGYTAIGNRIMETIKNYK